MPQAPYLPPEIVDEIIASISGDTLRESNRTLLDCALVCRDWLPASRCRLLNFLDLGSHTAYSSLVDNVLHSSRLKSCLASTETVWLTDPSEHDDPPPQGDAAQGWSYRFVHDFAGHLPNLDSLTIEEADWTRRPLHPRAHLALSRFTSLTKLSFIDCKLPSSQMLRRMVSALSASLDELELSYLTWPPERGEIPARSACTTRALGPALNTLRISCRRGDKDCLAPFLRWLSHTPTRHTLRNLSVSSTRLDLSPHANDYMAFVKAVAPGLVQLYISLAPLGDIPFQDLTSLEDLTLSIGRKSHGHWHTVARVLPTLPSETRIHHLGFAVWFNHWLYGVPGPLGAGLPLQPATIEDDGLELLEGVLQRDRMFRDLERVEITIVGSASESEAADVAARILDGVQRKLPNLASKGIITVSIP